MEREHKKQIWLRSDQADVVVACLEFALQQMNGAIGMPPAAHLAVKIAKKRVAEVLPLFRPAESR